MSDLGTRSMSSSYSSVQARAFDHGQDTDLGGTLEKSNGTTNYGLVKAGTPVGKITASGLFRPCGKTTVKTGGGALTTVEVNEADNFYIGDKVDFFDAATGALIATKTLTAVDKTSATHTVAFSGAIALTAADIVKLTTTDADFAGAGDCAGVMVYGENTFNKDRGPLGSYENKGITYAVHGFFYDSALVGGNALIKADVPMLNFS